MVYKKKLVRKNNNWFISIPKAWEKELIGKTLLLENKQGRYTITIQQDYPLPKTDHLMLTPHQKTKITRLKASINRLYHQQQKTFSSRTLRSYQKKIERKEKELTEYLKQVKQCTNTNKK